MCLEDEIITKFKNVDVEVSKDIVKIIAIGDMTNVYKDFMETKNYIQKYINIVSFNEPKIEYVFIAN